LLSRCVVVVAAVVSLSAVFVSVAAGTVAAPTAATAAALLCYLFQHLNSRKLFRQRYNISQILIGLISAYNAIHRVLFWLYIFSEIVI
jgi:hypothetical protein